MLTAWRRRLWSEYVRPGDLPGRGPRPGRPTQDTHTRRNGPGRDIHNNKQRTRLTQPSAVLLKNHGQKTNTYSKTNKQTNGGKRGGVFLQPHQCGPTHYPNAIRRTLNICNVSSLFHGWLSSWEQRVYCEKSKQLCAIRGKHYLRNGSWDALLVVRRDYHYNT